MTEEGNTMTIAFSAIALIISICCLSFSAESAKMTVDGLEPEYRAIHSAEFMYKAAVVLGYPARKVWDRTLQHS